MFPLRFSISVMKNDMMKVRVGEQGKKRRSKPVVGAAGTPQLAGPSRQQCTGSSPKVTPVTRGLPPGHSKNALTYSNRANAVIATSLTADDDVYVTSSDDEEAEQQNGEDTIPPFIERVAGGSDLEDDDSEGDGDDEGEDEEEAGNISLTTTDGENNSDDE